MSTTLTIVRTVDNKIFSKYNGIMKNRGDIIFKILDFIGDNVVETYDIIEGTLDAGYGASFNKLEYEYEKRLGKRFGQKIEKDQKRESKRRLSKYISKLKTDGLLIAASDGNNLILSQMGKQKLKTLKNKMPFRGYVKKGHSRLVIISFDIPELYRKERDWFREALKYLGFSMTHKSLWVGKIGIPKQLISDLEKIKILEYIKIFEVTKEGTLKEIN